MIFEGRFKPKPFRDGSFPMVEAASAACWMSLWWSSGPAGWGRFKVNHPPLALGCCGMEGQVLAVLVLTPLALPLPAEPGGDASCGQAELQPTGGEDHHLQTGQ